MGFKHPKPVTVPVTMGFNFDVAHGRIELSSEAAAFLESEEPFTMSVLLVENVKTGKKSLRAIAIVPTPSVPAEMRKE